MKKVIAVTFCLFAFYGLSFAKEIKIGVVLPMSGPLGGYGQATYKGIKLMNKLAPKLKNGDNVKIVLLDNKSGKIETANAMQRLVSQDKVSAVIGAVTSSNTLAITGIADKNKVPLVAPTATNVLITKGRKYVSRICFTDSFQGTVGAKFAYSTLKARKVVVITDIKNDYSIGISKVFKHAFKKLGGKILGVEQISQGDTDFRAILSHVKNLKPDLIYIPFYSSEAALIALQSKQLGIKAKFLGSDGMASEPVFFTSGKDAVNGFYSTDLYSNSSPKTTKLSKKFAKAYKKAYHKGVHPFAAMSADAYNFIVHAMNACKNPANTVCVNKNIRAIRKFKGVSGIISLDAHGNAVRSAVINIAENGKDKYLTTVNP